MSDSDIFSESSDSTHMTDSDCVNQRNAQNLSDWSDYDDCENEPYGQVFSDLSNLDERENSDNNGPSTSGLSPISSFNDSYQNLLDSSDDCETENATNIGPSPSGLDLIRFHYDSDSSHFDEREMSENNDSFDPEKEIYSDTECQWNYENLQSNESPIPEREVKRRKLNDDNDSVSETDSEKDCELCHVCNTCGRTRYDFLVHMSQQPDSDSSE